jgi:hypothetical protein
MAEVEGFVVTLFQPQYLQAEVEEVVLQVRVAQQQVVLTPDWVLQEVGSQVPQVLLQLGDKEVHMLVWQIHQVMPNMVEVVVLEKVVQTQDLQVVVQYMEEVVEVKVVVRMQQMQLQWQPQEVHQGRIHQAMVELLEQQGQCQHQEGQAQMVTQ